MKTISFRQDMIDLILAGKKTLTLRPIKPQPVRVELAGLFGRPGYVWKGVDLCDMHDWLVKQCPYGDVGDVVCVLELERSVRLSIMDVDVKKLNFVDYDTWYRDGVDSDSIVRDKIVSRWDSFYGLTPYSWDWNPFVWVIRFEVVK